MHLFFSLLLLLLLLSHSPSPGLSLNQEGLYLLTAKSLFDDPSNSLSDWNSRDPTPCQWTGISCTPTGAGTDTVTSINLSNLNLFGPFPEVLCRLDNLTLIDLSYNSINSTLPSFITCNSLSHLDLSQNLLTGFLPSSLSSLPSLTYLDLYGNNFTGPIPSSFAVFPSLQILSLTGNLLNGTIPSFLGNISTLRQLNLSYNPFAQGHVPAEIGNLSSLEVLWLTDCNLVGHIPDSLGKLSKLQNLDLSINSLTGDIPESLTRLSSVIQIELYNNSLSGSIPSGFSNISTLLRIDASMNVLEGAIPDDIFEIENLESLHLYQNQLNGSIPATVSKSEKLVELRLFANRLTGSLPPDFGRHSSLLYLDLSDNMLSGAIPAGVCERGTLLELLLIDNQFTGVLPEGLGKCRTLRRLRLANNQLSGPIPDGLWGLPHVSLLELVNNSFSGSISPQISGAANLSKLLLSDNQFSGNIPPEIGVVSNLYEFSADNNRLTGPLPVALGDLTELVRLSLSNNSLSGDLLRGIQSWTKLTELTLSVNGFTGTIPSELGDLPVLNYLDLSVNKLTGEIPLQLQNLKLNHFNLSENQLSGPIPPFYASEAYRDSFLGNPGLCGDLPGLCPSSQDHASDHHGVLWLLRSIFIVAALVLIIGIAWFYLRYRNFKKAKLGMDKSKWTLTSFHKLGFSEYEILDCLDEDNVIGSGASGRVYKAVLSNGEVVAVKKLWGPSNKSEENYDKASNDAFEAEVTTLGKIRHKNIVKLWCSCTHKDCKLLVYEYMPNGSLGDLLHSSKGRLLDWPMRYKIALDAAEGLSYLHHDCVPPIVHRDVKSNNILLDEEFRARVADFGVAKAVEAIGKGPKSMSVIAGSCGYIAPEYAYTLRVNEKSDIYSFGIVILELITGKPPVDPEFGEKDLSKWVCSTLDQKGLDHIIDPELESCYKVEICKVLNIGILCTSSLPINRPSMRRVVKMLLEVCPDYTDNNNNNNNNNKYKMAVTKDGKPPPYYDDASEHSSIA